jgi:hypothetical protein
MANEGCINRVGFHGVDGLFYRISFFHADPLLLKSKVRTAIRVLSVPTESIRGSVMTGCLLLVIRTCI